jgi:hypothetical protein
MQQNAVDFLALNIGVYLSLYLFDTALWLTLTISLPPFSLSHQYNLTAFFLSFEMSVYLNILLNKL